MTNSIKRIAVIGPESTGKSELCDALATHYHTNRVAEYARQYLSGLGRSYDINDIVEIYKTQLEQEQELITSSTNFIFIDTEFIIAKVWCEHAFKYCPLYIDEMIAKHPYDLYLLTSPDLPWKLDPLRENPGKGKFFFNRYKTILASNQMNFGIVSGTEKRRTEIAIEIIEKQLINTIGFRSL